MGKGELSLGELIFGEQGAMGVGELWARVSQPPPASRSLSGLDPHPAQDRELLLSALSSPYHLHLSKCFTWGQRLRNAPLLDFQVNSTPGNDFRLKLLWDIFLMKIKMGKSLLGFPPAINGSFLVPSLKKDMYVHVHLLEGIRLRQYLATIFFNITILSISYYKDC